MDGKWKYLSSFDLVLSFLDYTECSCQLHFRMQKIGYLILRETNTKRNMFTFF